MKAYLPQDIRNFAIVGHATAGKTMLSEAMLACAGVINRLGSVNNGTTVSDYQESERDHKISIHTSLLNAEWQGKKLNIADTPGYLDFISESLGALRVVDLAVVVIHANHGIGVGTDQVWRYATQYGVPKMFVINAADKERTDFDALLGQLRSRFGDRVLPMTVPINAGPGFNQVLDVLRKQVLTYQNDNSGKYSESPASGPLKDRVDALHKQLVEYIAESDDALLEKFFETGSLSDAELNSGIHNALQKQAFFPLYVTSAETNIGVSSLLDFIAEFGPMPTDRQKVAAIDTNGVDVEVSLSDPDPVLFFFKTLSEGQAGDLSFFRLYSGSIRMGMDLYNSDRKNTERIGQIYIINGKNRIPSETLNAGDLGAVVKLKDTHTGNTLCTSKRNVTLPKVRYPKPNIHASLKLKSKGEEDKVAVGLATLHEEDPTFLYHVDSELHQTVISGQGELHLQVISERLKRRYRIDFDLVQPRIPFRETIKGRAESKYRHKKQTGGAGQFAEVWMRIEPKQRNTDVEFTETLSGQNVDRVFVPSVEKGVMSACTEGVLAGYRIVDVRIDFYDGKMHPVDSKDIAFQIAGKEAFREAFLSAKPCLLEPIHDVEIKMPEECMGNVIGDLSSRRGKILGMDSADGFQVVRAKVPAMELYRYSSVLRSLTGGRGIHTEDFSHYEEMPRELEQKIITDSKKAKEEASKA
jgi:elongation factor G